MSTQTIQRQSQMNYGLQEKRSTYLTLTEYKESKILGPYRIGLDETKDEYEIKIINPPDYDWFERIIEALVYFDELADNWDRGGASSIDSGIIAAAMELLTMVTTNNTPEPYVFPTLNGGIQFEWHTENADLEIELISRTKALICFDDIDGNEKDWEQSIYDDLSRIRECIQQLI